MSSVFQIDIDHVRNFDVQADKVPNTAPTAATAGSDLNGMAAFNAAEEIRGRMAGAVAEHFDVSPDDIEFRQNRVYAGNESLSFAETAQLTCVARVSLSATGYYRTPDMPLECEAADRQSVLLFHLWRVDFEVVIDTLTGESRVLATDILQDVGASLNPAIDLDPRSSAFVEVGWLRRRTRLERQGRPDDPWPVDLQDSRQPRRATAFQGAYP